MQYEGTGECADAAKAGFALIHSVGRTLGPSRQNDVDHLHANYELVDGLPPSVKVC